ncbi:MAG: hypothetical protein P8075_00140 [Deltaproteobacteria bacterium]
MTVPLRFLIERLMDKGIPPSHISGLVRNVLNVIGDGGLFTTELVNEQLELLGWGPQVLDETSFQLIVSLLESDFGYRVSHYDVTQDKTDRREELLRQEDSP